MSKPRNVYIRKNIVHICYGGALWAADGVTAVNPGATLRVDRSFEEDCGIGTRPAIKVYQQTEDGPVREIWYRASIPTNTRVAA